MCGIAGIVDLGPDSPDPDLIREMVSRLWHRGPDGWGWYRDADAALGHARLAIIDIGGGAQPMSTADGSVWISFNGEIFNYLELRAELTDLGHRFVTSSDTEVLLRAWEQWGDGCFTRFNGQWAVAIWDRTRRRLVLCRDRLGVRPLYLTNRGSRLVFGSEVKALLADPGVPALVDPVGLAQVFTFWSTVAPRTAFAGIEQLPPGQLAVFDETGLRTTPYWQPTFPPAVRPPAGDLAADTAALRDRLVSAARLRFERSDVPVGAYLSGGLDSAVTAAVIAEHTNAPVHTFSLRFSDRDYDEGDYQAEMVARLGTRHHQVEVGPGDIARVFPQVVAHAETPLLRAAPAPMLLLSRLVAEQGFKVVVTGEGADEMLAGYDLFREARVRQFWARDPDSARRDRAVELLYPWMSRSPGQAPAMARSFFGRNLDPADPGLSHRPRWDSTSALSSLLLPDLQAAFRHDCAGDLVASMPDQAASWDPLARAQWLELTTLLPGYLLSSQGDRMLMASSVEGRFPFLDREVVEFCSGLPPHHKLFGLEEKFLLKRAFADVVPERIRRRPKQPYRSPDATDFVGPDRPDWVTECVSPAAVRAAGIFEPKAVAGLVAKCERRRQLGNTDNMRLLAVLSTQLLHRQFFAGDRPGATGPLADPSVAVDLVTTGDQR